MRQAQIIVPSDAKQETHLLARSVERYVANAFRGPIMLTSYTVSTLPDATKFRSGQIYVSNESGGAVPAFSDGTNWRRVTDRAIVS